MDKQWEKFRELQAEQRKKGGDATYEMDTRWSDRMTVFLYGPRGGKKKVTLLLDGSILGRRKIDLEKE